MTQDPHSSWHPPQGEQPVEPSAGPSQPQVAPGPAYGPPPGYAQPPQAYGQQGYSQQGYGPPPSYGYTGVPASAAPRGQAPTSAVVLVVLSGLLTLALSWTVVGLVLYAVPTVLAVVALTRSGSDPSGARRTSRTGWIVFGAVTVVLGLLVVVGAVLLAAYSGGSGSTGTSGTGVSV